MNEIYDLYKHTYFIVFNFGEAKCFSNFFIAITKSTVDSSIITEYDSYITYDKKKSSVISWGNRTFDGNKGTVQINVSRERLYRLFKKNKEKWNQDDVFLVTALSDFIRLYVEALIKPSKDKIDGMHALHYVFVVPSEWEEEIRESLIRPVFVQAGLISKDDHKDRLLFCTDVESIYYGMTNSNDEQHLTFTRHDILSRMVVVNEENVLIKLDLITPRNPLFDFSGSILFPKIVESNSFSLTSSDVKSGIRKFIKNTFCFDTQEETIRNIMKEPRKYISDYLKNGHGDYSFLSKPFITKQMISKKDKHLRKHIKSIRLEDICAEISKSIPNHLKNLLPNTLIKKYSVLKVIDEYTYESYADSFYWALFMLDYHIISLQSKNIEHASGSISTISNTKIILGAATYAFNVIRNAVVYGKPNILPTEESVTSSSIFLNSKPDAIMNIDITLQSTMLSFSLLDKDGLVKKFWNRNLSAPGIQLRPLNSYFSFSEVLTLNIPTSFITFVNEHFSRESPLFLDYSVYPKDTINEIEKILGLNRYSQGFIISTQQHTYIKKFLLIYMMYVHHIISRELPKVNNYHLKIGYAVTMEKILLQKLFLTEEDFRNIIYTSKLVQKNNSFKKLRVTTQGEELFLVIQQSFTLPFPLKSFFVVAQLHEDYVQLTLNRVVTESSLNHASQEAIIVQEEIITIPNILVSVCLHMWNNITEDSSLIQRCTVHEVYNDHEFLSVFSLENFKEFKNTYKNYISKNILNNKNLNSQKTDTTTIYFSKSCHCKVCFTLNDIIDISFQPVLQDMISLVFTSLKNNQLFGNNKNIQYVFHMLRFNSNTWFQDVLIKILKDETNQFLYDSKTDVAHYTIPKLSKQILQPILKRKTSSYIAFTKGVLYHVYSENYMYRLNVGPDAENLNLKFMRSDTDSRSVDLKTLILLFIKGSKINNSRTNRVFFLNQTKEEFWYGALYLTYHKLKKTDTLRFGETIHVKSVSDIINSSSTYKSYAIKDECKPFIISSDYEGYLSSLVLVMRRSGEERKIEDNILISEPMTLARF